MGPQSYVFRPMDAGDLPLLGRWLEAPHVVQWWGDPNEQLELLQGDLEHPAMAQFIVSAAGRPFGYLQCYETAAWPVQGFGAQPPGTRGIDQFIGEPNMVNRGYGSAFIRTFVEGLFASRVPRVLTDPDPANTRAIRAYEKAGFSRDRVADSPGGRALLMVRNG